MKSIIINSKSIQHWEESCNQYLSLLDRGTVFSDGELPTYAIDKQTCLQDFNAAMCMSSFASLSPLNTLLNAAQTHEQTLSQAKHKLNLTTEIPDICLFDRFYMEIITSIYEIIDENVKNIDLNAKLLQAKQASAEFDAKLPIFSNDRREKVYTGLLFLIPRFSTKQTEAALNAWLEVYLKDTNFMLAGSYFAPETYQWLYRGQYYPGVLLVQDAEIKTPLASFNIKNFTSDDII